MGALDELLASWRSNPDADSTVALCAYLGATGPEALVREVGSTAETWHGKDASVMLSVGRMYLDAGLLPEAQSALVIAGKVGGVSAKPFRYLGEVLLRRGDAARAEKVLTRAMQLGLDDAETRHWHDRSSFYIALQKRVGPLAVATEVAKVLPRSVSIPPPEVRPKPFASEEITNPKTAGGSLPRFDSTEEVSQVEELPAPTPAIAPRGKRAPTMIGVAPPPGVRAQAGRVVMPAAHKTLRSPPPPAPASFADLQPDLIDDDPTVNDANPLEEPTAKVMMSPFDAPTRPDASAFAQTAVASGGGMFPRPAVARSAPAARAQAFVPAPLPPPSVPPPQRPRSGFR